MLINYIKSLFYFLIIFFSLLFIITIFYYFDILSNNGIKYFKIITIILSCFLSGFKIGKQAKDKGYLKGLTLGSIILILFFLISLFTKGFRLQQLIYYLIILITTTIGSMVGILKEKK